MTSFHMAQQQEMPRRIYVDRRNANLLGRRSISYGKSSRRTQLSSTLINRKAPKRQLLESGSNGVA